MLHTQRSGYYWLGSVRLIVNGERSLRMCKLENGLSTFVCDTHSEFAFVVCGIISVNSFYLVSTIVETNPSIDLLPSTLHNRQDSGGFTRQVAVNMERFTVPTYYSTGK